mmetsp:Transcript_33658/g.107464  ORF Transcript_33658/g.107464 Transcript_33658/m.107464 type:complete len:227 (-) Transcript_33658:170-850(-)
MGKQWSIEKKNGPPTSRDGNGASSARASLNSSRPQLVVVVVAPDDEALAPIPPRPPPTFAATRQTLTLLAPLAKNLDAASCFRSLASAKSRRLSLSTTSSPPTASHLFKATTSFSAVISPTTSDSIVWAWTPLRASTTKSIMSMIDAPPMVVFTNDACPGQSTSVSWSVSFAKPRSFSLAGIGRARAENPRSMVIPRSCDWGCLSKAAVLRVVLKARTKLVFPWST